MALQFDSVQALGLLVQAMGALLIGLLCLMLNTALKREALAAWSRGWLSLGAALLTLLVSALVPSTAPVTLCVYLFCEYLFGYWLIEGCAHFARRRWPRRSLRMWILPMALLALAAPALIGYEFRGIFLLQALLLAVVFAICLVLLAPTAEKTWSSPGLLAIRAFDSPACDFHCLHTDLWRLRFHESPPAHDAAESEFGSALDPGIHSGFRWGIVGARAKP